MCRVPYMTTNEACPCRSGKRYADCCMVFHQYLKHAPDAEALMRSRFSAYAKGQYDYVFNTYGLAQKARLSEREIAEAAHNTQWLSLAVLQHTAQIQEAQVEFKAFYRVGKQFFVMHERSNFENSDGRWFYTTGTMLNGTQELKPKRNDLCPCGSNRKYKKCCGT